jgi:hypothetical protein
MQRNAYEELVGGPTNKAVEISHNSVRSDFYEGPGDAGDILLIFSLMMP